MTHLLLILNHSTVKEREGTEGRGRSTAETMLFYFLLLHTCPYSLPARGERHAVKQLNVATFVAEKTEYSCCTACRGYNSESASSVPPRSCWKNIHWFIYLVTPALPFKLLQTFRLGMLRVWQSGGSSFMVATTFPCKFLFHVCPCSPQGRLKIAYITVLSFMLSLQQPFEVG